MGDAPRCTGKSTRSGQRCKKLGLRRPDGTFTRCCRRHGGTQQRAAQGDPIRGGRPVQSGFYSAVLREEQKPIYLLAMQELGKLDQELALARTNLYYYQKRVGEQEKGGIPSSVSAGGQSVSIKSYADIVADYLNLISRMETRRARILEAIGASESNDSDLLGHEEWVASRASPRAASLEIFRRSMIQS